VLKAIYCILGNSSPGLRGTNHLAPALFTQHQRDIVGTGQFGDAISAINQLIRHDTFDGRAFYEIKINWV